jgi:hypothetical protein
MGSLITFYIQWERKHLFLGHCWRIWELGGTRFMNKACILYKRLLGTSGVLHVQSKLRGTVIKPLFTYSSGQKWLYLLQKVLISRYGFPWTYMWSGSIGQWPSKKFQKFDKYLELHVKVFNWSMIFPKTSWRPKTECQLEPNLAKWGGSYCKVKLNSSVSFLSIEFKHVDCLSSACLTQNKK